MLHYYEKQKADETKAQNDEEEQIKREEERNRIIKYELVKLHKEKLEREEEQQELALETKRQELELEKTVRSQNARLAKLMIAPFQGTSKDWIRLKNQYYGQVDNQPVSETFEFGYLLELVNGPCRDLIGNILNRDDGYDRALELLKKEFGQDPAKIKP